MMYQYGFKMSKISRSILKLQRFSTESGVRAPTTTPPADSAPSKKVNILVDLSTLSKLRLTSLVGFTTAAGFMCVGLPIDLLTFSSACIGTGLCAGSASTFNQIFEKERDVNMKRTSNRSLPSNRISIPTATIFGLSTGAIGTAILYFGTNPIVASLGFANIVLYSIFYTFSKRYTEFNTWIGSIVGAIPPVMGYAAASNGVLLAPEPLILSAILFLWQFPHFFALSWMYREDYARGGFQMVAVNDITGMRSAMLIQEYTYYLTALPIFTSITGFTSYMFALEGTAANMYLLHLVYKFKKDRSNANARKIFLCSLWYLPVLLIGYCFHAKTITVGDENMNSIKLNATTVDTNLIEDSAVDVAGQDQDLSHLNAVERFKISLKNTFKKLCLHEVIAYWNMNKNKQNGQSSNSTDDTKEKQKDKATAKGNDGGLLCIKIKSEEVIQAVTGSSVTKAKDLTDILAASSSSSNKDKHGEEVLQKLLLKADSAANLDDDSSELSSVEVDLKADSRIRSQDNSNNSDDNNR